MATAAKPISSNPPEDAATVVVRFAGDSGDGMQLTGGQFTLSTALAGNDLATFPDFPAEIRAPQGTLFGVSAFQINFGSRAIRTAGDAPDVLVAMNPAALKTNLGDLREGGLIIADSGAFGDRNLSKAGYTENPLEGVNGTTGGVNIIDLANLYSCSFIETQDLGRVHGGGSFEILGRFDTSDIRGCNLMML